MFLLSPAAILIAAAVVPAVWLLVRIYRADRLEPEPPGLILSLVLLGVFATGLALLGEELGSTLLGVLFPEGGLLCSLLYYFLVVALCEEGAKYLLLRYKTWNSPHFNCRFDGVVYAVSVALGFALWENISYVLQYGLDTAAIRAVTAVPGHACVGVFMGVWYGAARRDALAGDPVRARSDRTRALIVPLLLHGCYDFIATLTTAVSTLWFIAFVVILFLFSLRAVRRASEEDQYLY